MTKSDDTLAAITIALVCLGFAGGMLFASCSTQESFQDQKRDVEREAKALMPKWLPPDMEAFDVSCVTWCREVHGSEFDVEVIQNRKVFKVRVSCDTEKDKHSCGWRRLQWPCPEATL